MSYGLYISAEGAVSQEFRMRTIANNIANIETHGFKRELAMQQARETERNLIGDDYPGSGSINDIGGGVKTIGTLTEFDKLGAVMETGEPTDVCIAERTGWFVFENMQTGEHVLSRAGNFQVMADGSLVAQSGTTKFAVLDEELQPMRIENPHDPRWSIRDDGALYDPVGGEMTRFAIVKPVNERNMVKLGQNTYRSLDGVEPLADVDRHVKQGFLEGSSVNPATEMIEMIVASRAIETNVKMIQSQDEITGGLISRVLRAV